MELHLLLLLLFIYVFILIQRGTCLKLDYKFIGSDNLHFGQVLCASCYSMEMVNINHHDNINKWKLNDAAGAMPSESNSQHLCGLSPPFPPPPTWKYVS